MCGIAGWFEQQPGVSDAALLAMLEQMIPRGPDDHGQAEIHPRAGGRWLVGARRLAILDLSAAGHQPMHDPETGNCIVYNGEVYNFQELRRELEQRGCAFRSNCDTEVLLLGYRVWGEGMIARLEGMFAFAVWDQARQTMLLARDRHGIKPLYYFEDGKQFLFASELRALLATRLVPRELDPTGLDSFLKFGAVQEPATLIRNVRLLPAGHLLRWTNGGIRLKRYWNLFESHPGTNGSAPQREKSLDELRVLLARAVHSRLISDVPLGIFLSGGLDSTTVAALAAQGGANIKTFNVTFAEKTYAEGAMARRVAEFLGAEHHEIILSQRDLLASLPQALAAMDQPTVDGINTYFVSRATKQAGVTVALSGLGGDELFAGYRSFRLVPHMEQADRLLPGWARRLAGNVLGLRVFPERREKKLSTWLRGEDGYLNPFYVSRLVLTPGRVARLLKPDWLLCVDFSIYQEEAAAAQRLLSTHDPVNRVSCLELSTYMRNTLLRDADCMSMAHSLELRVPLIDHKLTEHMLSLPGAWKLNGRQRKPLLVQALGRPLPDDILRQPKHGFELPWTRWMQVELHKEIEETLAEPGPVLASALEWGRVQNLWKEFQDGRVHWSRPWLFYVLRKWCERHAAA